MSQWWSYGLSDFLMFSPQVLARLLARYNQALWPGQLLALAFGAALLLAVARPPRRAFLPGLLLAAAWAWTGWAFHWQRYAEIFLGAPAAALACWAQALLLLANAWLPAPGGSGPGAVQRSAGTVLLAAGVLAWPVMTGFVHGWTQTEVFGFMPEPTALATLGWLLAAPALATWRRAALAVLPLLSLALGLATRWALLAQ